MRKGVAILFALVMMLSAAHITIATHYCCGEVAATKVSLSGKLATCGMESTKESCPFPGNHLNSHCCDNKVTTIGIVCNFVAPVSIQNKNTQNILHISCLTVSPLLHNKINSNCLYTDTRPPGGFSVSSVNLDDICTFRI